MGQKCSCLFTKEDNDTFVFKERDGVESTGVLTNAHYSKFSKKSTTNISVLKDDLATEKADVLKCLIKAQSLVRRRLARQYYNSNRTNLEDLTLFLLNELLAKHSSKEVEKAEEGNKFETDGWKKFYKPNEALAEIFNQTERTENRIKLKTKLLILKDKFYCGEINVDNRPHGNGFGFLTEANCKLAGQWIDGHFSGYGRTIDADGTIKEGRYINGQLNGKGVEIKLGNAYVYTGDFLSHAKHGKGTEVSNETIYVGSFSNDEKSGVGKLDFKNNTDHYEGQFSRDKINGQGVYTWTNSNVYSGNFKDGKMHGQGHYMWPDGSEYRGAYVENIKEGIGYFRWGNGKVFEGPFLEGKPHGVGLLTRNGKTNEIEFVQGEINKSYKAKKVGGGTSSISKFDKSSMSDITVLRNLGTPNQMIKLDEEKI